MIVVLRTQLVPHLILPAVLLLTTVQLMMAVSHMPELPRSTLLIVTILLTKADIYGGIMFTIRCSTYMYH